MRRRLAEVHTVLPGRITKYDKATQLADVEVCVKMRTDTDDGETLVEDFPVIPNVPVEQLQTTGFFASFPIAANDFVWLHIVEQSTDKWMANGGVGVDDPLDRRFNLKDCYACLARDPKAPISETEDDAIVIGGKGSAPRVYLLNDMIALGEKSPTSFVALADAVLTEMNKIKSALAGATYVNSGGTPTTLVIAPYTLNSPAATKVKAK